MTLRLRDRLPAAELKRSGSSERIVGRGNEINASSKQDLIQAIAQLVTANSRGEIIGPDQENARQVAAERREALVAAYHDETGSNWNKLGAALAGELSEAADREGFMRRMLQRQEVAQGATPRMRVRTKNVVGYIATGPSSIAPAPIRDNHFMPPEWYARTNIFVEEREIAQTIGDILEDKFFEAQEALMVQEDKQWKKLTDATVGIANDLQILSGGLTPANLATLRGNIIRWGIPAQTLLIASDLWDDILGSTAFGSWFDPVSKLELVMTGYLGSLVGLDLVTDAYRHPNLKVLSQGDLYILSNSQFHGAYTDRGPVQSKETTMNDTFAPSRGWHMWELLSMVVFNARSVVKGKRT